MDEPLMVAPGIRRLTVNLDNEDVELFEGRWPVPNGVALHAYLVQGDRNVVIDPWDAGGYGPEELEGDLEELGLGWKDINAVAFTKAPAEDFLTRLRGFAPQVADWGLPTEGARHDLGGGVVLETREGFWFAWPSGVILTGDTFAGLGWIEDELWTEELGENDFRYFEDEALRWFSGRPMVPGSLPEGSRIVAPAHGCLWKNPENALARAQKFGDWGQGDSLDEVTVVWPGDPGADPGADALVGGALDVGAGLNLYRVPGDDPTVLASGARRSSLVVLAEGLDGGFLEGMDKTVWRPDPGMAPADLRTGIAARFKDRSRQ